MDQLTTAVFQELFATPENRTCGPDVEVKFDGGTPFGTAAIEVAHEAILAQGYSKISATSEDRICYSRLRSDGSIEYRSLRWAPSEKRITPDAITDPHVEDPFPSSVIEGFPIGIEPNS